MKPNSYRSYGSLSSIDFVTPSTSYISMKKPESVIFTYNLMLQGTIKCQRILDRIDLNHVPEDKLKSV